jgi:trk system potassium uptake protein TrkH
MILFSINFNSYYLILKKKPKEAFNTEVIVFLGIVFTAITIVTLDVFLNKSLVSPTGEAMDTTFGGALKHAAFNVASLISTTGFGTVDFQHWSALSHFVLISIMFIGACAGSTGGGFKVSRIVIALKGAYINVRKLISPRYVPKAKFEGKTLDGKTINDVFAFITLYFFIFLAALFLLAFDPVNGQIITIVSDAGTYTVEHGFFSNFSAVLTCISNVGPAFEAVGPYSSFAGYNGFSTIILTFTMMLGRLEILPVLILFNRRTWTKV